MQPSKRPRTTTSPPPRQYNDLQLALKFNEILGNINILVKECIIVSKHGSTNSNRRHLLKKITERYNKLSDKLEVLNKEHNAKQRLPKDEINNMQKAIDAYNEKSLDLDMQNILSISPIINVNTPPRSHSGSR